MQSRNSPSQCLYESSSTSPSILWKVSLPPFILPTLMLSRYVHRSSASISTSCSFANLVHLSILSVATGPSFFAVKYI
uniref:Uncharacterized protein n=1 Tax=Nelumbo nucifera TaxID=4432 RepID=A0A822Z6R5_NELNU|nr:TPA_asm: hypothetical protein HUJ06_015075 [Nelumbo nucifera]